MLHEIAPKRYDPTYKTISPAPGDSLILNVENELLVRDGDALSFPTVLEAGFCTHRNCRDRVREAGACPLRYLFSIDDARYFGILDENLAADIAKKLADHGFHFIPERGVRNAGPQEIAFAGALGNQFLGWYRRSAFCGRCGTKTVHDETERMMRCPHCGNRIYPDIHPSIMVAVFHGEKLLVTRYSPAHTDVSNGKLFPAPKRESLIAGYMETGETAEEAVRREVFEEVGLRVKNIRYYTNAPWPFSGSHLFAFLAEVDGDPVIRLQEDELSMAEFRSREELPERSCEVSLTSAIMEDFRHGII